MRERLLADAEERERPGVFKSIHPVRYLEYVSFSLSDVDVLRHKGME
jgi:hypothetical protein